MDQRSFEMLVDTIVAEPRWIIDGNYMRTLSRRIVNADLVVLLDIPIPQCLLRVIRRWFKYYNTARPGMHEGCKERIDLGFLAEIARFNREKKPKIVDYIGECATAKLIVLNSSAAIDNYLGRLKTRKLLVGGCETYEASKHIPR
jgi:adenylate kinase family enzyme